MFDPQDIIDAEVVSETVSETKPNTEPKKVASDHSKQVERNHMLASVFLGLGRGLFPAAAIASFSFAILHSQNDAPYFLVLLCVSLSMLGLASCFWLIGRFFRRQMVRHMKKDPNYEEYLN